MDDNEPRRKDPWKLPGISVGDMALVSLFLGAIWAALIFRAPSDEWWAGAVANGVLLWGLYCWKFVRANPARFRIVKPPVQGKWPSQFTMWTLLLLAFPVALVVYLLQPSHLRPGNVDVELQVDDFNYKTELGSGTKCFGAIVRVTNRSRNTLWYKGSSRGNPDWTVDYLYLPGPAAKVKLDYLVANGKPDHLTESTGRRRLAFNDGETFTFFISVPEQARLVFVELQFASSWFGPINNYVRSKGVEVPSDMKKEKKGLERQERVQPTESR